jgi:hypothetical protein
MNHTLKAVKKCFGCRCIRVNDEFIYGNKTNKSCIKCRDKRKRNRDNKKEPNEPKDNGLTRYIRHQRLFRKLNNEFLERAGKAVHMYNMKNVFLDIKNH